MTHSFPSRRSSDLTKADIASPPFLKGPAATDNASPQTSLNKNVICSVVPDDRVAIVFFTCKGFTNRRVSSNPLRKSARYLSRGRSEEHTSELQSLMRISYAVFCLNNKTNND